MPWTRMIESVICRRHVGGVAVGSETHPSFYYMLLNMLLMGGSGGPTAEARCKGDMVQGEMAEL